MKFYFLEIKNRFTLVFILQVSTLLSLYYYKEATLFIAISPVVGPGDPSRNFMFTGVTEPLTAYLIITYFINVQLTIVFALYQLVFFLTSGFYGVELRRVFKLLKFSSALLVSSSIAANLVTVPVSWLLFLDFYRINYGVALGTHMEFKLLEYLKFYVSFHCITLIYFQLTGLLFLLVNYRQMTLKRIGESRKALFLAFFFLSALVCPDVISLIAFAGVMIAAYEFHIIVKLLRSGNQQLNPINTPESLV